jgi:hypothetical protein
MVRAEDIRRGADDYALAALDEIEQQLTRLLATVRKGKATLERSANLHVESDRQDGPGHDGPGRR